MQPCKTYVGVTARFLPDGQLLPVEIQWEDGRRYAVDRVLDVRRASSLKAGGYGLRYTCQIRGRQTYLFFERDRWFVERRSAS